MTFSIEKRDGDYPWAILEDGHKEFLTGIQSEEQAANICALLNRPPLTPKKTLPLRARREALLRKRAAGSVLVEFALCLPLLLLLILGGIDLDIAAQAKQNLSYVVTASATCIDTPNCDPAALAQQNAAGLNLNAQYLTVTVNGKTVTGAYAYQPFSPFLPVLNLSATAVAP